MAGGLGAAVALLRASAAAAAPPPITSSDYTLQLYQGTVTGATRVLGFGGAYSALAEGIEGLYANAAAPVVRRPYSVDMFDYDVNVEVSGPGVLGGIESLFAGKSLHVDASVIPSLGLQLQYGPFGVAINYQTSSLHLTPSSSASGSTVDASVKIDDVIAAVAWSLLDGQMQTGVGFRSTSTSIYSGGSRASNQEAIAPQLGIIVRPNGSRFRVGVSYRFPVTIGNIKGVPADRLPDGSEMAGGKILPSTVWIPWQLEIGGAFQFGPRPLNPEWIDPTAQEADLVATIQRARLARTAQYEAILAGTPPDEREVRRATLQREEEARMDEENATIRQESARLHALRVARSLFWSRKGVLVLASVLVTGGFPNSVGVADFLDQNLAPYGATASFSPRLGMEAEMLPTWIIARLGTYLEPARSPDASALVHGTAGVDLRLGVFNPWGLLGEDPWCIRVAVDGTSGYFNWAIALSKYH
jgi:hypothetical protein